MRERISASVRGSVHVCVARVRVPAISATLSEGLQIARPEYRVKVS